MWLRSKFNRFLIFVTFCYLSYIIIWSHFEFKGYSPLKTNPHFQLQPGWPATDKVVVIAVTGPPYLTRPTSIQLSKPRQSPRQRDDDDDENIRRKRLPNAIIIGAMKSGTSMLKKYIGLHPDVKTTLVSEVQFFHIHFDKGMSWYIEQMEPAKDDEIVLEKSLYFGNEVAVERVMKVFGNDIKLIIIVKDPVQRLISHFAMMFESMKTNATLAELVLIKDLNGKLTVNTSHRIVQLSHYAKWMKIWLDVGFNLDNFLIIDGHKFVKNPIAELERMEKFLNLKHMLTKETFYFDETKGFYCISKNFLFADGTPSNHRGSCAAPVFGRKHPIIKPEHLEILYKYFAPLNRDFFDLIGFEIPNWNFYL